MQQSSGLPGVSRRGLGDMLPPRRAASEASGALFAATTAGVGARLPDGRPIRAVAAAEDTVGGEDLTAVGYAALSVRHRGEALRLAVAGAVVVFPPGGCLARIEVGLHSLDCWSLQCSLLAVAGAAWVG